MFNLKELRTALSECHVTESSLVYKTLQEAGEEYFLLRAEEAVKAAKAGIDIDGNLKLAIQLLNIKRVLRGKAIDEAIVSGMGPIHDGT